MLAYFIHSKKQFWFVFVITVLLENLFLTSCGWFKVKLKNLNVVIIPNMLCNVQIDPEKSNIVS